MADKTNKKKDDDKKAIKSASKKQELSDKDLDKVSGGGNEQPALPRAGKY